MVFCFVLFCFETGKSGTFLISLEVGKVIIKEKSSQCKGLKRTSITIGYKRQTQWSLGKLGLEIR